MNVFVLIGHQNPGSFCHAIAATAIEELEAAGHEVVYHDLYAERVRSDPAARGNSQGRPARSGRRATLPRNRGGRRLHVRASELVGHAAGNPQGLAGPRLAAGRGLSVRPRRRRAALGRPAGRGFHHLEHAPRRRIAALRRPAGKPLEDVCASKFCGVEDFCRRNFEPIILSTAEERKAWLDEVRTLVRRRFPNG